MNKIEVNAINQKNKTVTIHRRGMMSLVSCVISSGNNNQQLQQSSRCVWPLASRRESNILSRRVYGKGW